MRFFSVDAKQGPQYFHGEWEPYPRDLHALYVDPFVGKGLHVRVRTGTKPGDLIFATPNVVSERFLAVLRECKATGYDVFPAPLVKDNIEVATYYGLKVHGRGGPFDKKRSDADMRGEAVFGHSAVYMDESQWDGSDVFFVPGLGISLFVTERVAKALKRAKLVNVKLTLNSECRTGTKAAFRA